jgi:FixJ family two-component response regulator
MRGTELAACLRQLYPKMSVLFISGYTDPSISAQVVETGSRFLQKPFKADDLLRATSQALGR